MFYQRLEALIKNSGKKQVEFLRDTGINRGTLGQWRTRGSIPNAETIQKIADYFGVSVAYLIGKEETKKAPAENDRREVNDEDIKFALFGGGGEITDEMYEEVKRFAAYVKQREAKG